MLTMSKFRYEKPGDLKRAFRYLSDSTSPKILAGGTDLIVQMKRDLVQCDLVLDIKGLTSLTQIQETDNGELRVGAAVTLTQLERWVKDHPEWSPLASSIFGIGSQQIRNRATVLGNICRASPAGDMAPLLMTFDASVAVSSPQGNRIMALDEFVIGPGQIAATKDEIVTSLHIPALPSHTGAVYIKHGIRSAMEVAIVGVAVRIGIDKKTSRVTEARLAIGAVTAMPIRVPRAEEQILNSGDAFPDLDVVSTLVLEMAKPIDDFRSSAVYRRDMIDVCVRRAVTQTWEQLRGGK